MTARNPELHHPRRQAELHLRRREPAVVAPEDILELAALVPPHRVVIMREDNEVRHPAVERVGWSAGAEDAARHEIARAMHLRDSFEARPQQRVRLLDPLR